MNLIHVQRIFLIYRINIFLETTQTNT